MKKVYIVLVAGILGVCGYVIFSGVLPSAHASDRHHHGEEVHDGREDEGGHGHGGHDEHEGEEGHGHGGHDEHGHDEHEEGRTEIDESAAQAAGIKVSTVEKRYINDVLTLTGRVILNRNKTAEVRARFRGIVQDVRVSWGETVEKGQVLATIEANESLKSYRVLSPIDGVVLSRNTNIGNVAGEEALFTIADLSEVWAEFHVFPRDLVKVKKGQDVAIRTLENTTQIVAPMTWILPMADPLSQTVVAIAAIQNGDNQWRPGMTVEGDVLLAKKQLVLAVTENAVQRMENKTVIFVKEGDVYEMRPVILGKRDGAFIEVREGVSAGERYVSEGSFVVKADIGKSAAKHEH